MSFKVPMHIFLALMISVGIMPMATAQQDPPLLNVSSNPPRKLYQEVNTLGRETQYAQAMRGDGKLKALELLNVSYDPTRELWRHLNAMFISKYLKEANTKLEIKLTPCGRTRALARRTPSCSLYILHIPLWA